MYEQSFKLCSSGIACAGMDGQMIIVNPALCGLLGYDEEELLAVTYFALVHPADWQAFQLQIKQLKEHVPSLVPFELRMIHKSGQSIWTTQQLSLITIDTVDSTDSTDSVHSGQQPVLHIHINGISMQKRQAEQALIKSQRSLAEAQKIACIGSWDWDIQKDEIIWTEQLFCIVELHPSRVVGKSNNIMNFVHPDDREQFQQKLGLATTSGMFELECRLITAKRHNKYVYIQGIVILDEQGAPHKIQGIVQDISERKQSQALLEETYDRYTSLKNYNPDAIMALDRRGIITSANPAAKELSGYTIEELKGGHFTSLLHDEDASIMTGRFKLLMKGEQIERADIRMLHKDGHVIDLLVTLAPIIIQQQLTGCYVMVKDVTEQKKRDEMLRNSEKLSVVGQLAAGVAHEIRNPLTALKGFIQLMLHSNQQVPKYLDIMKEELERIELIVSELLVLSKPQSLQLKSMNLKDLAEEVMALIGTQAIMNNIEIVLIAEQDHYPVYCDPNQIKQIIINFLKNSIEAMKKGGVIKIQLTDEASTEYIVLSIEDQGSGIPEELLSRLGEPFFTTKEGGTGLGLMISHKIIEQHGGQFFVTSKLKEGTRVEVRFPLPT
ncbi:PAS domain S-box protein [Paenibacillus radicis (ex Xue et al. 2023)]|uniref:histidine kinase n=1 Tax=Paenibacillus radicis (ex Xue et al. 2023) TaxID=2972489 RepID=A0ABT1YHF7_9BACL|nr:PAS domain S-box protein [Paenibacillus radicis (ex Xue et al. 2023)]MCR8632606.1 PAS domain S-box protein [Paenibacillus radicis (ex Xue et al. 2023)]